MSRSILRSYLKVILELGKVRISLPVAFSALTGYALQTGTIGADGMLLAAGVFFMSCSSGAVNHVQEHKTDLYMPRTRNRPIPSGQISPAGGVVVAAGYFILGAFILIRYFQPAAFIASLLTLLSYNAFYTPLKRVTAFAVVPGSLVGALPPYIGWLAAGGGLTETRILLVAIFFFIGQIPHFWLLLLMFGKEYRLAGYPSLNDIFSENQIMRLSYTWILSTVASALIIALKVMSARLVIFLLIFYVVYLLFFTTRQILQKKELKVRETFFKLNFLYLFMMIALVADSLLRSS